MTTARQLLLSTMYTLVIDDCTTTLQTLSLRVAQVSCRGVLDAGVMTVQSLGLGVSILAELSCDHTQRVPSHCHVAPVHTTILVLHTEKSLDSRCHVTPPASLF